MGHTVSSRMIKGRIQEESRSSMTISSAKSDQKSPTASQIWSTQTNVGSSRPDADRPLEGAMPSWSDLYSISWRPREMFLKFRQHVDDFQIGANLEFEFNESPTCNPKLVFKPISEDRKWKVVFEPKQADLQLLTKKISVGPFLSLQVGLGHDFRNHTTGWSWKISSIYGESGGSQIKYKASLPVLAGFDLKFRWNAEYILPEIHGGLGTGEPFIGMDFGHLYGSLERVEAVFTSRS